MDASSPSGLTSADFDRVAQLVGAHAGIRLPPAKAQMVEGRLRKRARAAGYGSTAEYCRALFSGGALEREFPFLIDAITTNKTDFFREPEHFDLLAKRIVPLLLSLPRGAQPLLKIWSAAASTGAEAYTLAMVLSDLAAIQRFRFAILGTDISTRVLAEARRAVYSSEMVLPVPKAMQQRYLMRARRAGAKDEVRVVPELRRLCRFDHLNLMDPDYGYDRDVDVIFLRNVLIYFDKDTQVAVLERLVRHLRAGGFVFLGHSESMIGNALPLRQVAPAVFQKV